MTLEIVVFVVVLGNLFCGVLGWLAGRSSSGALRLDVASLQQAAEDAASKYERARDDAEKDLAEISAASKSDDPNDEIAKIINRDRQ